MVYPYRGILVSNERITTWMNFKKLKKPDIEEHILYNYIYTKFWKR